MCILHEIRLRQALLGYSLLAQLADIFTTKGLFSPQHSYVCSPHQAEEGCQGSIVTQLQFGGHHIISDAAVDVTNCCIITFVY